MHHSKGMENKYSPCSMIPESIVFLRLAVHVPDLYGCKKTRARSAPHWDAIETTADRPGIFTAKLTVLEECRHLKIKHKAVSYSNTQPLSWQEIFILNLQRGDIYLELRSVTISKIMACMKRGSVLKDFTFYEHCSEIQFQHERGCHESSLQWDCSDSSLFIQVASHQQQQQLASQQLLAVDMVNIFETSLKFLAATFYPRPQVSPPPSS